MSNENLPERYKPSKTLIHGLWSGIGKRKMDGRTQIAKAMKKLRDELFAHCGGNPTVGEQILIQRVIAKTLICHLYETSTLSNPTNPPGSRDYYLAYSNGLRLDLQALGLKRKNSGDLYGQWKEGFLQEGKGETDHSRQ